jgi:ribonuclease P protein component
MKETKTLKLNRDFRRLYARGRSIASGYVVVYAMKNRLSYNRLGLTTGKTIGNAVRRNRARRLMRESYAHIEGIIEQGYDIVIVARSRIAGKACPQVQRDLEYAMRKSGLLKE